MRAISEATINLTRELMLKENDIRREAIERFEKIVPVIEKFDGKVINKRFNDALKEVDPEIFYHSSVYGTPNFIIEWGVHDDYIQFGLVDRHGYKPTYYTNTREVRMVYMGNEEALDGKRLIAEKVLERYQETVEKLEADIKRAEDDIKNLIAIADEYNALYKEVTEKMNTYSYDVYERFGMKLPRY